MTSRAVRVLVRLAAVVVVLSAVLLLAGGWYFSGEIRRSALEVREPSTTRGLTVVDAGPATVTLEPGPEADDEARETLDDASTYGLEWPTGYGQVTDVVEAGAQVRRRLDVLVGATPEPDVPARLRRDAFPPDPAVTVPGVREVTYRSPAGTFPAWRSPGDSSTWAVLVHGRGATRTEMLRLMRTTAALGMPSLDITYRRDAETGGGLAQFGQDEWVDLEAAVQYALDAGAERVVLLGASMGGGIVASFLESSPLADRAAAVVLDAPMLDLAATIRHGAAQRELPLLGLPIPRPLTWTARQIAGQRFDLDASRVDYLDDTSWLTVPALVLHGTEDGTVPDSVTRRLAAAEPGLVDAVLAEGADHVEAWNLDPAAYDARVLEFLRPFS